MWNKTEFDAVDPETTDYLMGESDTINIINTEEDSDWSVEHHRFFTGTCSANAPLTMNFNLIFSFLRSPVRTRGSEVRARKRPAHGSLHRGDDRESHPHPAEEPERILSASGG